MMRTIRPRFALRRMMTTTAIAVLTLLFFGRGCRFLDDQLGEGNRYKDAAVAVIARDKETREVIDPIHVALKPGDRNILWKSHDDASSGPSGGPAIVRIHYPTFHYRHQNRPDGYAFFEGDFEHVLTITAIGYETQTVPFPRYVVSNGEFPPPSLPAIEVDLKKVAK